MTRVEKSVLVMYPALSMWQLVEDIPRYSEFLPWCSEAVIHEREAEHTKATIFINFHGLKQQFTTSNTSVAGERVLMELVEGPFQHLRGEFVFKALREDACKIEFVLEWTFSSKLLEKVVGPVFQHIANTMVDAFVSRADDLHSRGIRGY
ncbi:type II toxin-antitoxin system RatA family toxin [Ferrovum sp. PN-J185]|uniref:type II toxin-antitoxin system RatA family toxin n=1 Tax=Ferrovum sp. PN-J185 TaxID=1356306 RepID=UPI00079CD105|nr:type II toxin-antitoxin system RatA family toxin [Ferrovum sp. PN-J185]KXW56614.1 persistence and stress-resistance toxin PasT [Ferrovum sp. PN-J185]MCC6068337.1 type II toxin-antitoxin system RatA family toxin [Ferrovum sp. PN-J185]